MHSHSSHSPRPGSASLRDRGASGIRGKTLFGYPRDFLDNRFVYLTVSPSARGLSVGVNMCPAPPSPPLDAAAMGAELAATLRDVIAGRLLDRPAYRALLPELRQLRQLSLSGDGEPLRCPVLVRAVETALHVRAASELPFFKIVLITSGLAHLSARVREGVGLLTAYDELWVQLDAGTEAYFQRVRGRSHSLGGILENVAALGRERDVVIQSLFLALNGEPPPPAEIDAYVERIRELLGKGIGILRVQISSVPEGAIPGRPSHLALPALSAIATQVQTGTGLAVEIF